MDQLIKNDQLEFVQQAKQILERGYNNISEKEIHDFINERFWTFRNRFLSVFEMKDGKAVFEPEHRLVHTKPVLIAIIQEVLNETCDDFGFHPRFKIKLGADYFTKIIESVKPVMTQKDFKTVLVDALPEFIEEQRKIHLLQKNAGLQKDNKDNEGEKKSEPKEKQTKKKQKK